MHLFHCWKIKSETDNDIVFHCACGAEKNKTKYCPHVWKITEKVEHPSFLEQSGGQFKIRFGGPDLEEKISKRTVVATFKCEKCNSEKIERI